MSTYAAQFPVSNTAAVQIPIGGNVTFIGDPGATVIYLGGSNVSSANGAAIQPKVVVPVGNIGSGPLYALGSAAGTLSIISG